jgi:transposase InsO family protein
MSAVVRRLQFVKLVLRAQQSMSQLCRLFGFSRKRGYKWKARYAREGPCGLRDRSRRPARSPQRLASAWLARLRRLRRRHRSWGSRKLATRLRAEYPRRGSPAARTVGQWLKRLKLQGRSRRRSWRGPPLTRLDLTAAVRSNHVWTVDFKGWFRTQDGQRVEPLTVRDLFSRYLLSVCLLRQQNWRQVRRVFQRLFRQWGYPEIIRLDNGAPFGSTGPAGLSRLSAWWAALGIRVQFIAPGRPDQNGGHEQMHRVLKAETTRPTSCHLRAQRRRTARWVHTYNQIRPHQGLGQRTPGSVYRPQRAPLRRVRVRYPGRWGVRQVRSRGQIKWRGRQRFVGEAFIGYPIGLKGAGSDRWAIYFAGLRIGELREADAGGMRPARYPRRRQPPVRRGRNQKRQRG